MELNADSPGWEYYHGVQGESMFIENATMAAGVRLSGGLRFKGAVLIIIVDIL